MRVQYTSFYIHVLNPNRSMQDLIPTNTKINSMTLHVSVYRVRMRIKTNTCNKAAVKRNKRKKDRKREEEWEI